MAAGAFLGCAAWRGAWQSAMAAGARRWLLRGRRQCGLLRCRARRSVRRAAMTRARCDAFEEPLSSVLHALAARFCSPFRCWTHYTVYWLSKSDDCVLHRQQDEHCTPRLAAGRAWRCRRGCSRGSCFYGDASDRICMRAPSLTRPTTRCAGFASARPSSVAATAASSSCIEQRCSESAHHCAARCHFLQSFWGRVDGVKLHAIDATPSTRAPDAGYSSMRTPSA